MPLWFLALSHASVIGFALLGGVFLAFSDFIMRALSLTQGARGVEAMQHINREVFRIMFMALFLGMAPVSLILAGYGGMVLTGIGGKLIALAGIVYLLAAFGVTIVRNVPLNEALARMDLAAPDTARFWTGTYLPRWTFWNSLRAAACVLASALVLTGLMMSMSGGPVT